MEDLYETPAFLWLPGVAGPKFNMTTRKVKFVKNRVLELSICDLCSIFFRFVTNDFLLRGINAYIYMILMFWIRQQEWLLINVNVFLH